MLYIIDINYNIVGYRTSLHTLPQYILWYVVRSCIKPCLQQYHALYWTKLNIILFAIICIYICVYVYMYIHIHLVLFLINCNMRYTPIYVEFVVSSCFISVMLHTICYFLVYCIIVSSPSLSLCRAIIKRLAMPGHEQNSIILYISCCFEICSTFCCILLCCSSSH